MKKFYCEKITFDKMTAMSHPYFIQSFVEIGSLVLEKKIFEGFLPYMAWRPTWSCDQDYLYIHCFPLPIDVSYKIWL